MQALAIGKDTLLRGEYRLLEAIGGGESRVYLARREGPTSGSSEGGSNASSPWVVARLWKPSPELLRERGAQHLFERAAGQMRQAALLRHPVLAMVETSGALDDGTLFIVAEHIEGKPLDVFINSAGIPPLPSVIDLAYRICSGLNTAHRNGLAHAALHPGSVIVRPNADGSAVARLQAKLIDFGTPTCMFGSPPALNAARFMAPEQLELALKPAIERAEPTVRMNVYGCGALLYAMCTGGPPTPGKSVQELLLAHAAHKVVPPSRINPQVIPALDAIILKALDPEPRARFANAAELANALISIRFERSASGVRPRAPEPPVDLRAPLVRGDATPRDQRATLDPNDEAAMRDAGLEERPTSRTSKLPKEEDDFVAFPSERPTAEVHIPIPSIPPLPRLSPPPPSLPPPLPRATPVPEVSISSPSEDVTAQAPLPPLPTAVRRETQEPPAVLAHPARRSIVPQRDWLGYFPPVAFIALAALFSIAVILAVISQPSDEPTIEVTPLPAPPITPRVQEAAPIQEAPIQEAESAGASAPSEAAPPAIEARVAEARVTEEPSRSARPRRAHAPKPEPETVAPPEPEEPSAKTAPVQEPEPKPEPKPAETPEARSPAEETPAPSAPAPAPSEGVAQVAPKRSPIAPLPDKPDKPIAPLPEKALPRVYDVAVKGSLATSHVRRGIERLQSGIQACYRAVLAARPAALGEVSVEVLVDERGRARDARAGGNVPGSLKSCLEGTARKLSVPPPDTGTVTASWKVSL